MRSGGYNVRSTAATAEIHGTEGEVTARLAQGFTVGSHFGYLHGKYVNLLNDINGAAPGLGYELKLVRLPSWSYGAHAEYVLDLDSRGSVTMRTDYGHVDAAASQDNNAGFLPAHDLWNATLAYRLPDSDATVSLYVKNLLDDIDWTQEGSRAAAQGGGRYRVLNKGRVIGISLSVAL